MNVTSFQGPVMCSDSKTNVFMRPNVVTASSTHIRYRFKGGS